MTKSEKFNKTIFNVAPGILFVTSLGCLIGSTASYFFTKKPVPGILVGASLMGMVSSIIFNDKKNNKDYIDIN